MRRTKFFPLSRLFFCLGTCGLFFFFLLAFFFGKFRQSVHYFSFAIIPASFANAVRNLRCLTMAAYHKLRQKKFYLAPALIPAAFCVPLSHCGHNNRVQGTGYRVQGSGCFCKESAPMQRTGAELFQGLVMQTGAVTFVLLKAVLRKSPVMPYHKRITTHFCDDRSGGNQANLLVSFYKGTLPEMTRGVKRAVEQHKRD